MYRIGLLLIGMVLASAANGQDQRDEVSMSIYFGGGSYYIDSEQGQALVDWLDSIPNLLEKYEIQLISHTDPIGGKEFNDWLSRMRSDAVKQRLLDHAIPEHKISVKDWGLENPVYRNDSHLGRAMNRRVDVVLHPIVL